MAQRSKPAFLPHSLLRAFCAVLAPRSLLSGRPGWCYGTERSRPISFLLWRWTLCGADLDRRSSQAKFCRKHHIIWNVPPVWSLYWHWSSLHLQPQCFAVRVRRWRRNSRNCF